MDKSIWLARLLYTDQIPGAHALSKLHTDGADL